MEDNRSLAELICEASQANWPRLHDAEAGARIRDMVCDLAFPETVVTLLSRAASCSPYLERLMGRNFKLVRDVLYSPPARTVDNLLIDARETVQNTEEIRRELRCAKDRLMLLLSLCDLAGIWSDLDVMRILSRFADEAVCLAFEAAFAELSPVGEGPTIDAAGFVIIAMGKHGAEELNYSSDIDLVVFYAPEILSHFAETADLPQRMRDARKLAIRVTQQAVGILQDQTADGYVFRTDLRLRPDPGASSVAVPIPSAELYYETYGQNWERAAFSKARIIAGNTEAGKQVSGFLQPFIWRKYLDYAAIEDIHSIKRQIHAVKGMGAFEFRGHDIKLGRGGIREIEFFVQTQQLILGGKDPTLRERTTNGGLYALAAAGHITEKTALELQAAYLRLRNIEHRIQMVNDEQTHLIPKEAKQVERLARLAGYDGVEAFEFDVVSTLTLVHNHYADLFEEEERLAADTGSLVFTGVDDDPSTMASLSRMGYGDPSRIAGRIRRWHTGAMRSTKTPRARELLTRLVPVILRSFADTDNPQTSFMAFDAMLEQLPSGVQFFSLILNNPEVLHKIASLVTISPVLSKSMASHAHLIEALLGGDFLDEQDVDGANDTPEATLPDAKSSIFEEALNALRRRIREGSFQVTAQLLLSNRSVRRQAQAFTRLADSAISTAIPLARQEIARAHGETQGHLAVIGMGRLGAQALTATSDLDLIFVYDTPRGSQSNHEKPLDGMTWFTRYVRRVVTALSAQTEEGGLYEVDMALRPSGGAGPAAVSLAAFERYYDNDAWTWEEMSLVKARVIAGDPALARALNDRIETILTRPRDAEKVRMDVLDMRRRLLAEKPAKSVWDLKRREGGLTDIDFICQYLSLIHGARLGRLPLHIEDAFPIFVREGALGAQHAEVLTGAYSAFEMVLQITRAAIGPVSTVSELSPAVLALIAEHLGIQPIEIENYLEGQCMRVCDVFNSVVGNSL